MRPTLDHERDLLGRSTGRVAVLLWLISLAVLLCWAPPTTVRAADTSCAAHPGLSEAEASRLLSTRRPFVPGDRDLFHTFERADWADVAPLGAPGQNGATEQEAQDDLRAFLQRRFPRTPERVVASLSVFTDYQVRRKVPDPTLRAALASLVGTIGQQGIPWLVARSPIVSIRFGIYMVAGEGTPQRFAGTYRYNDGTVQAVFDGRYRSLPFGAFTGLLFHELLHLAADPDRAGLFEEVAASSLEALVYMQTLLVDPSLALLPDALTRVNNNRMALVRLNSGPADSDRLTLFVPDGEATIDPLGVEPLTQFRDYYPRYNAPDEAGWEELETSGNDLLRGVLPLLSENGAAPPEAADFNQATLEYLDQNQGALTPTELVRIACILRLDLPCPQDTCR